MKLADIKISNLGPSEFWRDHLGSGALAILPLHAEKWYLIKKDASWNKLVKEIDVFLGDGVGFSLGYFFLTGKKITKCSGIDLINALIENVPKTPTYIWGTRANVITAAAKAYKKRGLNVVGFHDGFSGRDEDVLRDIKDSGAELVFVGMNAKRAASLVLRIKKELGVTAMTAGGSFDVSGGVFNRSPKIFQKIGLEWLWRMLVEPARFKRLPRLFGYVWYIILEKVGRYETKKA